jgi:hypothetical protein
MCSSLCLSFVSAPQTLTHALPYKAKPRRRYGVFTPSGADRPAAILPLLSGPQCLPLFVSFVPVSGTAGAVAAGLKDGRIAK